MDYMRLEKEMAANKMSIDRVLQENAHRCEDIQVDIQDSFFVFLWRTLSFSHKPINKEFYWTFSQ